MASLILNRDITTTLIATNSVTTGPIVQIPPAKSAAKLLEFTLATSEKILALVKQEILSSHDIIPAWEIREFTPVDTVRYIECYGSSRVLKLLQLYKKGREARIACQLAIQELGIVNTSLIRDMAVSKFGIGECAETSTCASLKCCALGAKVYSVRVINRLTVASGPSVNGHHFLFINIDENKFEALREKYKNNLFQVLEHMKQGFLLDPFLNFTCEMREFKAKATKLVAYAKAHSIQTIEEVVKMGFDSTTLTTLQEQSLSVYNKAQEILIQNSALEFQQDLKLQALRMLEPGLKGSYLKECIVYLKRLSRLPDLTWKSNVKKECVWVLGSEMSVLAVKMNLGIFDFNITMKKTTEKDSKGEAIYAGFLENPNLDALQEIITNLARTSSQPTDISSGKEDKLREIKA